MNKIKKGSCPEHTQKNGASTGKDDNSTQKLPSETKTDFSRLLVIDCEADKCDECEKKENYEKLKIKGTGTKEWADSNVNIAYGCSHDCKYCYAKKMAIRFKRETERSWKTMRINTKKVNKGYGKRKGRIMFPSSHDVTP